MFFIFKKFCRRVKENFVTAISLLLLLPISILLPSCCYNIYHIIRYGENKKNICEIFYLLGIFQVMYYHGFKNWTEAKIVFAFGSQFNQVFD